MYAKVFQQILDSSIAEDWQTRHVFEDFLKLADINGVVDMMHEAIARRTNVPIEIVRKAITDLEQPDPKSRNPDHKGRRIVRLDDHRDWGWHIVNYDHYRNLVSEEQRREKTRIRVANFREKHNPKDPTRNAPVTLCNAPVTTPNAGNAMQMEMERKTVEKTNGRRPIAFNGRLTPTQNDIVSRFEHLLGDQWDNGNGRKWMKRCRDDESKTKRIADSLNDRIKTKEMITTAAQCAEYLWETIA